MPNYEVEQLQLSFAQMQTRIYQMFIKFNERLDLMESNQDKRLSGMEDNIKDYIKIDKDKLLDEFLRDVIEADVRMDAIEKRIFKR